MREIVKRADDRLADTVLAALKAEPSLAGDQTFVTVDGGAATLYGRVHSEAEADLAERVALATPGIVAVAQAMFVSRRVRGTDSDIARTAAQGLLRATDVPEGISATVRHHVLTLTGVVDSQFQRAAACRAVRDIEEAQIIVNAITVRSERALSVRQAV
ncbi:BON domain-containing protein [Nakamurella sp. PAMC28650]|jgi:osmotically-inducible protein OsmY|uniref:BON domain-containing protein n=1 Tax=Nakamurella sp. PAMC28650 TaxID=2762325 RepID=UPI00164E2F90|nr:BON domain-containing protein [Nakamurella sp. PAMC28650]QNK80525.1 BON domain-containing protein [Nakamurella sp. PAMC28650]